MNDEKMQSARYLMAAVIFARKKEGRLNGRIVETIEEVDALITALKNPKPVKAREARYRRSKGLTPEIYSDFPIKTQRTEGTNEHGIEVVTIFYEDGTVYSCPKSFQDEWERMDEKESESKNTGRYANEAAEEDDLF